MLSASERQARRRRRAADHPRARRNSARADRSIPEFEFESTVFWDQLVAGVRTAPGASASLPIEAIRSHVGVVEDDAETIFHGALLLYLVIKEAQRVGIEAEPDKVARVTERFRQSHGLTTAAAADEWTRSNGLGRAESSPRSWRCSRSSSRSQSITRSRSDAFLPAELQRRGRLGAIRAAIAEKRAALEEFGLTFPSAEDLGTTTDELLSWYETRFRPFPDLEEHVAARRLADSARFVREVLSEYLVESRQRDRAGGTR